MTGTNVTVLMVMMIWAGSTIIAPQWFRLKWNGIVRWSLNKLDMAIEREIIRVANRYKGG